MYNIFDLTNKVAIITGASSGLGFQMSKAFAESGADVALLARRFEKLETIASELSYTGRKIIPVKCDITKEMEVEAAVNLVINTFGKIDILVNNAGIASIGSIDLVDEFEWDRVIDTNLKGVFFMSKHVVKYMKEKNYGKIINISSICGNVGSKNAPLHAYNASKGGVINLTRGMATSLAKHNITVNSIGPALFQTEMTENSLFKEDNLKAYNQVCPAGRPGNPGELNGAAIYFASDASSYTTGQTLFVDGGWTSI